LKDSEGAGEQILERIQEIVQGVFAREREIDLEEKHEVI